MLILRFKQLITVRLKDNIQDCSSGGDLPDKSIVAAAVGRHLLRLFSLQRSNGHLRLFSLRRSNGVFCLRCLALRPPAASQYGHFLPLTFSLL
jgi:hypothetical protein